MILLTGATGTLGKPLLTRLTGAGEKVRVLVREPRRLGPQRVKVQIAIGNLADRHGFDKAMRGVDTLIHLGATTRDQARGSIQEVNGLATNRLLSAAKRAGVKRVVYVSSIGASPFSKSRFVRMQALSRDAILGSGLEPLVFDASIIYAPDDPWISLLRKLSRLPVLPVPGDGTSQFQPIWAEDAADALTSAILNDVTTPDRGLALVGPEVLTHDQILETALRNFGADKRLLHISPKWSRRLLYAQEAYLGPSALATWGEAQLMQLSSVTTRGAADMRELGVDPIRLADVLSPS
ncbi:MAG: NAD(P)H-binding protein [Solirubrobacterales bacterium]